MQPRSIILLLKLMTKAIKNIILKSFLVLMAALVLNQSIDEIEFQPLLMSSNIEYFNDLNSAVEYIAEIVLGHKDMFPEFQKNGQHKQSSTCKHVNPKAFNLIEALVVPEKYIENFKFAYPLDEKYTFLFSREIIQPPNA